VKICENLSNMKTPAATHRRSSTPNKTNGSHVPDAPIKGPKLVLRLSLKPLQGVNLSTDFDMADYDPDGFKMDENLACFSPHPYSWS